MKLRRDIKKIYTRQAVMGGGCGVWWVGVWTEALKYEIRKGGGETALLSLKQM